MTWQRLEGAAVGADLEEGLEARIADPLWLLAKQWLVGELHGEDAASPVLVEAAFDVVPMTVMRSGPPSDRGVTALRGLGQGPLECVVERERVADGPARPRLAAEAGLSLLRALDLAAGDRARLRARYPFVVPSHAALELDPTGQAELALLARRSLDGFAALAAIRAAGSSAWLAGHGLDPALAPTLDDWVDAMKAHVSQPAADDPGCWSARRMAYRFQVAGASRHGELQLDARDYAGGRLDWYAFDFVAEPEFPLAPKGRALRRNIEVLPSPVRYPGMPASRWWEIEDAEVWFGDVVTAPEDLARGVVAGFATVYGDDWFFVPCRVPAGSLVRIASLDVLDDFGGRTPIRACAEYDGPGRSWRFFELDGDPSADAPALADRHSPWTLVAPVVHTDISEAIEEVHLVRDEVANLAWGIERTIESPSGRRIDRHAAWRATAPPRPAAAEDAWRYLLATEVPDHHVPLIPIRSASDGSMILQRGRVATSADDGRIATRGALGRLLEPERALFVYEEEVPATGACVVRHWQIARNAAGASLLWVGRRKGPAPPERGVGASFDRVVTKE